MQHKIKKLAEAITNIHTKKLVLSHVTGLHFENEHLVIYVDNAGPLHELGAEEMDHHLQNGMEKVYGDITYEIKLDKSGVVHERGDDVSHDVH